jgi:Tfp pilus assembly protein PilO
MKRRHNAKFWLLMTALGFVGGAALVGFQFSGLNADKAHVHELSAQTQDESAVQGQLAKSQQDLDGAKAQLTHLEQGIPGTAYIPTMLQELAKAGSDAGISVTGVRPVPKTASSTAAATTDGDQTVQKPAYDALDIEVKGRGNYAAVMKFITALQTFPKIVGSRTISISPCMEPSDNANGLVDITIGLRAYLFADNAKDNSKGDASKPADATDTKGDASKATKPADAKNAKDGAKPATKPADAKGKEATA